MSAAHGERGMGSMQAGRGFTLIETIVVLALLGIVSVFGSLFLIKGIQGYLMAESCAEQNLKAQAAMTRLDLEFDNITTLPYPGSATNLVSLTYTMIAGPGIPQVTRTIARVGQELRMINGTALPTSTTGNIVIDQVSAFRLDLHSLAADGFTLTSWNGANISDLYAIKITLTLNNAAGIGGGTTVFTTMSTPRRHGQYNGPQDWNR